jgi:hypothetical protein
MQQRGSIVTAKIQLQFAKNFEFLRVTAAIDP